MSTQITTLGLVVIASGVNVSGTFLKGSQDYKKDPMVPVIAGFVIGAALLAVDLKFPQLAEALAGAFLVTSALQNGKPLIDALVNITNTGGKSA